MTPPLPGAWGSVTCSCQPNPEPNPGLWNCWFIETVWDSKWENDEGREAEYLVRLSADGDGDSITPYFDDKPQGWRSLYSFVQDSLIIKETGIQEVFIFCIKILYSLTFIQ